MFRRHWSGLPEDISFPANLKDLGYFVNDEDEIRSIENPDNYFRFFINKNDRINQRQRFAFNQAMERIIHERIERQGLQKLNLPIGTPTSKPHVPIFADVNIKNKTRIIVIFGETTQDLGLVAGRVANGAGGINKGSMVSVIQALRASTGGSQSLGIILANMGQLYWWPEGGRAITIPAKAAIPLSSLVHYGVKYVPSLNDVPGNESPKHHVQHIFGEVLPTLLDPLAKLDIIAIGDSCDVVEKFLHEETNWKIWGPRMSAMVLLQTIFPAESITNASFKEFLAKRTRCYTVCADPLDMPLAPPSGNPNLALAPLGCPIYSSSESYYVECILISALEGICSYLRHNALHPDAENDAITVVSSLGRDENKENEPPKNDWDEIPEEERPFMQTINPNFLMEQSRNYKMWAQWEKTGAASKEDDDV